MIESLALQLHRVEGRMARQQFIEQHPQRVDVAARVNVQCAPPRLFGAHVGGGADELLEGGKNCLVRQTLACGGFGDSEINDFGHGGAVVLRHQNVGGFEVAVDDALVVGVLNGLANRNEQLQALAGGKLLLVAVVGDLDPAHQFHDKIGPPALGGAGIEDLGDIGVVHQRQRLALGLEASHHLPGVHAQLDDLEGDTAADGFLLLGHIDHPAAAFANFLEQLVVADAIAGFAAGRDRWRRIGFIRRQAELQQTGEAMAAGRIGRQLRPAAGTFWRFGHLLIHLHTCFSSNAARKLQKRRPGVDGPPGAQAEMAAKR